MLKELIVSEFRIEIAKLEHVPEIWAIVRESFKGDQAPYVATSQVGFRLYLEDLIAESESRRNQILVAIIDGRVAAFVDITLNVNAPHFLTRVAVSSAFRGKGIAKKFMRQIGELWGEGNEWELDVLNTNLSAIKLYESMDFTTVSIRKWIGRSLTPLPPLGITVVPDDKYLRYGFTKVEVDGNTLSIAGNAVRCHKVEQFQDMTLLSKVQERFPSLKEAFIIVDESNTKLDHFSDMFLIVRSHRMRGIF